MDARSDFEAIGGHDGLHRLVDAFIDRVAADPIIGFFFDGVDLTRVKRHEAALAAQHLGGPAAYAGRPLAAVHRPRGIGAGHFRRRHAILRTVLTDHGVDPSIIARWIAHEQRLEAAIVAGPDCAPSAPGPADGT